MKQLNLTHHFFTTRHGVQLSVWDYGGDGPPLTMGHCTGTCARCLDPVIAALNNKFRVLAIDCRGHGDSAMPEDLDTVDMVTSGLDLLDLVDHFKLTEGIYAMGHSGGGAHVINAALERPGTILKALLVDPIVLPAAFLGQGNRLADGARRRRNEFESKEAARERLTSKPPKSLWRPEVVDAYLEYALHPIDNGAVALNLKGENEARFYEQGGSPGSFERLSNLSTPCLLLSGTESYLIPILEMQKDAIPNASIHLIEGGSHFVPLEQPEKVAEILLDYFK